MTSSTGKIIRVTGHLWGTSPVPGEFSAQRSVTRSFDVFFDLRLNKRLSKQWRDWWLETPSSPSWRHCNVLRMQVELRRFILSYENNKGGSFLIVNALSLSAAPDIVSLMHLPLIKMSVFSQTAFLNASQWMKILYFEVCFNGLIDIKSALV